MAFEVVDLAKFIGLGDDLVEGGLSRMRALASRTSFMTQRVAVDWEIYQRLHLRPKDAALALGFIGLAQVLPMIVFALPAARQRTV